jgi:hypothetical protein
MKSNKNKNIQLEFNFCDDASLVQHENISKIIESKLEEFGYSKRDSLAHCCLDNIDLAWANEIGGLDPITYGLPPDDPTRMEIDLDDAYNYLDTIFTPEFRATLSKEYLDWYEEMRPSPLSEISDDVEDEDEFSQVAF